MFLVFSVFTSRRSWIIKCWPTFKKIRITTVHSFSKFTKQGSVSSFAHACATKS